MEIVNYNPDPVDKVQYQCTVCGLWSAWTEDHRHIERPVGEGYAGYEVHFITCSDECRVGKREKFIEWLSKYPGWTKKKAADNFDKYIKSER